MRAFVVHLALAFLMALPLAAQSDDDILFSLPEGGYTAHPGMLVQVADSHAGVALAAWGSSRLTAADSVVMTVYVQQIRGGIVVGKPHRLGLDDFQLTHEFCVVPLAGDFLVVYNAYPPVGGDGTFFQFYDSDQDTLGPPSFLTAYGIPLDEDGIARTPPYALRSGDDEWMLFWRARTGNLLEFFSAKLNGVGQPLTPAIHAGAYETTPLTYREHDDFVLFNSPFDDRYPLYDRPRVCRPSTGAYDPRTLPFLFNSFHIAADTSVVIYRDSTIIFYPSLFDTSRYQSRTLDLSRWGVGRALPLRQPSPRSIVTRDSAGRIHLYLPAGREGGSPPGARANCAIVHIQLDRLDAPEVVDTLFTIIDSVDGSVDHRVLNYLRIAGCDNRWQLRIIFGPLGGRGTDYFVQIDPNGSARSSRDAERVRCLDRPGIDVRRISADTTSAIKLGDSSDPVRLDAPLAWRPPPPSLAPAVVLIDTVLSVAWHVDDTLDRFMVTPWPDNGLSVGQRAVFRQPPPERSVPPGSENITTSEEVTTRAVPFAGAMLLEHQQHFRASFIYYPFGFRDPQEGRALNTVIALARAGPKGWNIIDTVRRGTTTFSTTEATYAHAAAYDPDDETLFAWMFMNAGGSAELRGYPRTGARWEVTPGPKHFFQKQLIPLAARRFLVADGTRAFAFEGGVVFDTIELPVASGPNVRFTALRGSRFLITWAAGDVLQLRALDGTGATLAQSTITVPAADRLDTSIDHAVVESPVDSSIAVVIAGRRGARVTRLSQSLRTLYADSLLSQTTGIVANPCAVFHADTLYAVWEDLRDTVKRIYGNRMPRYVPGTSAIDDANEFTRGATGDDGAIAIMPNPATDEVVVELGAMGAFEVDLVDMLGRVVVSRSASGSKRAHVRLIFDLSAVAAGVYFIRIQTTRGAFSRALVKW